MPWRELLERIIQRTGTGESPRRASREDVRRFLDEVVAPALHSVARELSEHGRDAEVEVEDGQVSITVYDGDGEEEFYYAVRARAFRTPSFAFPEMTFQDEEKDLYHRAMVYTGEGSQRYGIMGYEAERVIANFMHEYDRQMRWQKPNQGGD